MATVIPVDEFITDEWYPGFKPGYTHAPWYIDPVQTFRKEDEENFWFLDFHWPRGLTPMGLIWNEDGYNWSSQLAAEQMPLPPGRGITCRLGGTHTYGSPLPVTDVREIGQRARRLERMLPPFLQNFDEIWGHMREEVNESWDYFSGVDLSALSLTDLRENLIQARQYHKRAFEIHFEVMYPLLANYVGFYSMCTELGLDPGQIGKFLQGYDTKIMETDRELWKLTTAARRAGLEQVFASHEADGIRAALAAHGGPAGTWLTQFDDFLQVYGWRTEGSCDIALPSWIEDPTPALGTIKTFLLKDTDHDFEAARNAAVEEREAAVDAARSTLTLEEQKLFDGGLASCRAANFPWWQDDHNYYIYLLSSRTCLCFRRSWACRCRSWPVLPVLGRGLGRARVLIALGEGLLDGLAGPLGGPRQQVAVDPQREAGVEVAQVFAQRPDVHSCGQQERGVVVPQLVHPGLAPGDARPMPRGAPRAVEGRRVQLPAPGRREQQRDRVGLAVPPRARLVPGQRHVGGRVGRDVRSQRERHLLGQRHHPFAVAFRQREPRAPGDPLDLPPDMDLMAQEVDRVRREPEDLALPQPERGAAVGHRLVPPGQLRPHRGDLRAGPRDQRPPRDLRRVHRAGLARVRRDPAVIDGGRQDQAQRGEHLPGAARRQRQPGQPPPDGGRGELGQRVPAEDGQDVGAQVAAHLLAAPGVRVPAAEPVLRVRAQRDPPGARVDVGAAGQVGRGLCPEPLGVTLAVEGPGPLPAVRGDVPGSPPQPGAVPRGPRLRAVGPGDVPPVFHMTHWSAFLIRM